jgi:hypothetical protein
MNEKEVIERKILLKLQHIEIIREEVRVLQGMIEEDPGMEG